MPKIILITGGSRGIGAAIARLGAPGRVARVKEGIPMKRGGHPDEVAKAVLWLLSEGAAYTTGASIDVAGGR